MVLRHYPVNVVFDALAPDSAETRTTTVIITGRATYIAPSPPTVSPTLVVYHDTWRKTAEGWKKSKSVLRYTTCTGACCGVHATSPTLS
jgi:hypothetical protein